MSDLNIAGDESVMTEAEFNERLDSLMLAIEDAIEKNQLDIDYETNQGILTLTFASNSKIILSRQVALRQLWMATQGGGFHFNYVSDSSDWICDHSGEEFVSLLNKKLTEQSGSPVSLHI